MFVRFSGEKSGYSINFMVMLQRVSMLKHTIYLFIYFIGYKWEHFVIFMYAFFNVSARCKV